MSIIPPVSVDFSQQDIDFITSNIEESLKTGFVSQGKFVNEFENAFAQYTGAKHAVALSSGSAAIEIAMRIKDVRGKKIIMQANTNFATITGALRAGAEVILSDIDIENLVPSVENLEAVYTPDVSGVILVHMGGIISRDISRIKKWCENKNIWLFEDCAHAHGSTYESVHAGRFGFAGAYSFFATKVITSCEGGILITDDDEVAEQARLHRNLGKPNLWDNYHVLLGSNFRMSEFNALIGLTQLRRLDDFIQDRQRIADEYISFLQGHRLFDLILPGGKSSWYKFILHFKNNIDFPLIKEEMNKKGIKIPGRIYEIPLHKQPVLQELYKDVKVPVSEQYCENHICLPIFYNLASKDVRYISQSLHNVLEKIS